MRTDLVGSGGLLLAADVDGPEDGPTVVLLHGGGQTRHSWTGTWRYLVDAGWRAWSVDLRGHGDSTAPDGAAFDWEGFADDVLAVVDHLGLHGGVAVGQGMIRLWPDWMGVLRSKLLAWAMLSAVMR